MIISCDPVKTISIKKNSDPNIKVVIYGNEKLNPEETLDSKRSTIKLKANENIKKVYYGIGNWDNNEIKELSNNIDSIAFVEYDETILINDNKQIQNFLIKNRKGILKNTIIIKGRK